MKKFYLLLISLVVGFSAEAAPAAAEVNFDRRNYGDAFIFVERGVEFAVFPDGQFDFFFDPRGNFKRIPSHINYSFNSGYNYGPFVQYDDYGAVIQIENVPVYYDYYGRIIQAGRVQIRYNAFGMVNRIGNMFVHYNPYHNFSHTSGYINGRNVRYVYRPWHDYYMRPHSYTIVYNEPYRLYYHPDRMKYSAYRNYYQNNYYNSNNFQKSYYKPGDRVTSYHRGRRVEEPREVRKHNSALRGTASSVENRRSYDQREAQRNPVTARGSERNTRTSRVENPAVEHRAEQPRTIQQRAVQQRVEQQREVQRRNVRESRSARTTVPSTVQQETTRSATATPAREVQAQTRRVERSATANPVTEENSRASTRGTRSSRRGN